MKRDDHPLTGDLVRADAAGTYVRKVGVWTDDGRIITRRPFWVARWGCWCVRYGGWMPIERKAPAGFQFARGD